MATQAYNNNGIVSKNGRKSQNNHPDIRGSAVVGGVEYWVAGWQKTNTKGTYYSLAFTVKDGQQPKTDAKAWEGTKAGSPPSMDDLDDDIQF